MSEYQYLEFRAVDRPLTDKELSYAREQSSRAEISRWSFTNEYHFGDFRGNANGMLRRGYDVFLHYANFGVRTIKIRLPAGLPFGRKLWSKYIDGKLLKWKPDPKGSSGTLALEPYFEPFDSFWEFNDCLDDVVAIRERLIAGDLRALYLLWLCVAGDDNYAPTEVIEPPVPVGLQEFGLKVDGLFYFYDIDPLLVDAAADLPVPNAKPKKKTPTPIILSPAERLKPWLKSLGAKNAKEHLEQLLVGDTAAIKAELLAEIARDTANSKQADWPVVESNRTFDVLLKQADVLRQTLNVAEKKKQAAKAKRDAAKAKREHEKRVAEMIKDPQKWLAETERLADQRGTDNYKLAAEILTDLKEAIGGPKGASLARKHAAHLIRKYPTLTRLKGLLRKHGILD